MSHGALHEDKTMQRRLLSCPRWSGRALASASALIEGSEFESIAIALDY